MPIETDNKYSYSDKNQLLLRLIITQSVAIGVDNDSNRCFPQKLSVVLSVEVAVLSRALVHSSTKLKLVRQKLLGQDVA